MYHVALVNFTDKKIFYAEQYKKKEDAIDRIIYGLEPQAALNVAGGGELKDKGKEWAAWGPEEYPFTFAETVDGAK